ncbi:MAG: bacillithiol biosynthesis deacetylase BshB1 [Bacteroidetes bacterium]|nr:bacillithiol biosynthesis deacetylase BshB1 [Bacteroidota bacterium]
MKLDVLFFGAHPDDVELSAGGTVAKLVKLGYQVGICDLTRGEAGTRGSAELRDKEARDAATILGVSERVNCNLPDTVFKNTRENQLKVIEIIRKYQPEFVFVHYWNDRHPDHIHASDLVRESTFYAGLPKIETAISGKPQAAFRPRRIIYYAARYEFSRTDGSAFVVDITDTFQTKIKAMEAFSSQFYNPAYQSEEQDTYISTKEFRGVIESRARHYGSLIDAPYGEPFLTQEHLSVPDPIDFFRKGGQDINKLGFA